MITQIWDLLVQRWDFFQGLLVEHVEICLVAIIIAIVFGGMPVSGGPRSRITAAVVGAFSMGFLTQIMTMLNLGSGFGQMIKAAIFLAVVFIAMGDQRGKLLTR